MAPAAPSPPTVKSIHLVRHARAARAGAGEADHERPLSDEGRDAAARLGAELARAGIAPDLVLCSTARRAEETLGLLGLQPPEREVEGPLYQATAGELLERLRAVPDTVDAILLVGHNPAIQQLALTVAVPGGDRERLAASFPAGALASLDASVDVWTDLAPESAQLRSFVVPDELE